VPVVGGVYAAKTNRKANKVKSEGFVSNTDLQIILAEMDAVDRAIEECYEGLSAPAKASVTNLENALSTLRLRISAHISALHAPQA
jgi:hypothetical protein